MHKVRLSVEDRKTKDIKATQIAQFIVLRVLDGSRVKNKRSMQVMLEKFDLLSVNQTAAQIKLQKTWKADRDKIFPIKMTKMKESGTGEEHLKL